VQNVMISMKLEVHVYKHTVGGENLLWLS